MIIVTIEDSTDKRFQNRLISEKRKLIEDMQKSAKKESDDMLADMAALVEMIYENDMEVIG